MYPQAKDIKKIVNDATTIVVLQADNPDADSLGSALALEHMLGDLDKNIVLYCAVDIPSYLRYLPGWDRVVTELPNNFDVSIMVDVSTETLFEKLYTSPDKHRLSKKPCIVIDHHATVDRKILFATTEVIDGGRSSTGELLYYLAKEVGWSISIPAGEAMMAAILGDTQGLTNQLTSADTYTVMAELVSAGVDRSDLEARRRDLSKMDEVIFRYKGRLLQRTKLAANGKLAYVVVTNDEIRQYSPLYNPGPLVQNDMLQIKDVAVSIVLKEYDDGRITAAIRSNIGAPIAGLIASKFNGGGHDYASGFKITDGTAINTVLNDLTKLTMELLQTNDQKVVQT